MKTRLFAVMFVTGVFLGALASPASAHALLKRSDPEDGALLDKAPPAVLLTFTEAPDPSLSLVKVLDQTGKPVSSGEAQVPSGEPNQLRVSLPSLARGVYTVSWRVLSRADGHVTAGSFSFGVGVRPTATPGARSGAFVGSSRGLTPLATAGRWGFYWGVALLLGAVLAGMVMFRALLGGFRIALAGAWVLAAAGLVAMFLAERSDVGASTRALLTSGRGHLLVARGIALGITGLGVVWVALRRSRASLAGLGVAVLAVMLIHAYGGHAGAASSWRWFRVGTQWFHLIGAGVWIGGLGWLLFGILRPGVEDRVGAVKWFSLVAGYALAVVAATGFLRALDEVGSFSGLIQTGFGNVVIAKVGVFGAMALLGAVNRYRIIPSLRPNPGGVGALPRTIGAELMLAASVFALTGVMTELSPPATAAEATQTTRPQAVMAVGHDFAQQVNVRLTATPGTAGPNSFQVRIEDYETHRPVAARRVTLGFSVPNRPEIGTSQLPLTPAGPGVWRGSGTNLSIAGPWQVGVLIEQATTSVDVPLSIRTRTLPQQIKVIPGGPGQPVIYQITLPGVGSVQGYVDPGRPGPDELHFTFFRTSGNELPIGQATAVATAATGTQRTPALRRLSAGHFVGDLPLSAGTWRFMVDATTKEGTPITASFEEAIK